MLDSEPSQDHRRAGPDGKRLFFKGAVGGKPQGLNGNDQRRKKAHGTEAFPDERTQVVDGAWAGPSPPNLEIANNAVRCSQRPAVGPISDEEQRFYPRRWSADT